MNDNFGTMSAADLEALQKKAAESLKTIQEAVALKAQSAEVLARFHREIEALSMSKVVLSKSKEGRGGGGGGYDKWVVSVVPQQGPLVAAFEAALVRMGSAYSDPGPWGTIPMAEFWAEWAAAVQKLTALMVNRYAHKYVAPIPTDTVENIEAYKVGQKITEAATPRIS